MSGEPAPRCAQLWGPETEAGKRILEQIAAEQQAGSTDISTAKRRKNRWTSKTSDVLLPVPGIPGVELSANLAAVAALIDPHSATLQLELAQVRERLHRISQGQYCDLRRLAERSPSPEPTYNVCGSRNNARALRHRETLQTRQDCIVKELLATCHGFRPPEDWRPKQKTRQLSLRESELVGHDALQRMLGLRGRARQDIEHRTGATISLQCAACAAAPNSSHSGCTPLINTGDRASTVAAQRRGAIIASNTRLGAGQTFSKEGSDPAVVLITADTQAAIDAAVVLLKALLAPAAARSRREGLRNGAPPQEPPPAKSLIGCGSLHKRMPQSDRKPCVATPPPPPPRAEACLVEVAAQSAVTDAAGQEALVKIPASSGAFPVPPAHARPAPLDGSAQRPVPWPATDLAGAGTLYGPPDPAAKLFVGQLPQDISAATLRALFEQYGSVEECDVIKDRETGAGRGFAFVAMSGAAEAQAAMRALDGFPLGGRRLQVAPKGGIVNGRTHSLSGHWPMASLTLAPPTATAEDKPPGEEAAAASPETHADERWSALPPPWSRPEAAEATSATAAAAFPPLAGVPPPPAHFATTDVPPGETAAYGAASDAEASRDLHTQANGSKRQLLPLHEPAVPPKHSVAVGLTAAERRRAAQREHTREAQEAAELARRRRLMAAAATAAKAAAPERPKAARITPRPEAALRAGSLQRSALECAALAATPAAVVPRETRVEHSESGEVTGSDDGAAEVASGPSGADPKAQNGARLQRRWARESMHRDAPPGQRVPHGSERRCES